MPPVWNVRLVVVVQLDDGYIPFTTGHRTEINMRFTVGSPRLPLAMVSRINIHPVRLLRLPVTIAPKGVPPDFPRLLVPADLVQNPLVPLRFLRLKNRKNTFIKTLINSVLLNRA